MKFIGSKEDNKVLEIPTIQIRPNKTQPRKSFDEDKLRLLSQSIVNNGILQPLTVRRLSQTEYELVAGERRLRAAALAGLTKVPCVLIKCTDKESAIFALLENIQRSDLNMFEEAKGISRLIRKFGLTQEEAARKLGKKQSTVANKLRLLKLSIEEQDWILQAGLS
ncbi:MAG: ParB/RepB/Spo0J family partition protein, partial [Ruminococcus sp.]|nr:ParB/RepB/Spo0J family partition protein [Ruminococcus sp.]